MADALIPLYSSTLASAVSSVTISGLPQGYRDLRLIVNASVTPTEGNIFIQVNGDAGSNYTQVNVRGFSTSSTGSSTATGTNISSNYSTGLQTTSRAINIYDFLDYSQTDKHKAILIRANHSDEIDALAGRWASTSAITSIFISANGTTTFAVGSSFTLYAVQG